MVFADQCSYVVLPAKQGPLPEIAVYCILSDAALYLVEHVLNPTVAPQTFLHIGVV